jgi:hypothetical protein
MYDNWLTPYYGLAAEYTYDSEGWITWEPYLADGAVGKDPVGFCVFPSKKDANKFGKSRLFRLFSDPSSVLLHVEYKGAIVRQEETNIIEG